MAATDPSEGIDFNSSVQEAAAPERLSHSATDRRVLFDRFPYGLVLVDGTGLVLELNARSAELLGVERDGVPSAEASCCELICDHVRLPREGGCLTRRALEMGEGSLSEVPIELPASPDPAWVVASNISNGHAGVVFHVRPSIAGGSRGEPARDQRLPSELRIHTLGEFRIEDASGGVEGAWLRGRPGQLLKYLVCERSRPIASEQIAEALWPDASQREAMTRVRQYVYQLRAALERDPSPGSRFAHIATHRGGYALEGAWVDAEEFERLIENGLRAWAHGEVEGARAQLEAARRLYRGDFLAEDPYAAWALVERDRLRDLASRGLRAQIEIELAVDQFEVAADRARDLTEADPLDVDVWRRYLELCLRLGRRSEAARKYALLRNRMRHLFGDEPGFTLAELTAEAAAGTAPLGGLPPPPVEQLLV